jgi:hypothetical protein
MRHASSSSSSSSKQGLGKTACSNFIFFSWSLQVILIIPQHRVPVCGWVVKWWGCHLWASRLSRFSGGVSSLRQLSSLIIEVYLPLALPFLQSLGSTILFCLYNHWLVF